MCAARSNFEAAADGEPRGAGSRLRLGPDVGDAERRGCEGEADPELREGGLSIRATLSRPEATTARWAPSLAIGHPLDGDGFGS